MRRRSSRVRGEYVGGALAAVVGLGVVAAIVHGTSEERPAAEVSPATADAAQHAARKGTVVFWGGSFFPGSEYYGRAYSMASVAGRALDYDRVVVAGAPGTGLLTSDGNGVPAYDRQLARGAIAGVSDVRLVVVEPGRGDATKDLPDLQTAAVRLVRQVEGALPGAEVVLLSPIDTDGDESDLAPLGVALTRAAAETGARYVDATTWLVRGGDTKLVAPDGRHPTGAGAAHLGAQLARALA